MSYAITGEAIVQRSLQKAGLGKVLRNAEIDSLAAGALTSVLHLRNGNLPPNYWRDRRTAIYWPAAPGGNADRIRYASTLTPSTGALEPDTDWGTATLGSTNLYLLPRELDPVRLVDALNRAMRKAYFENSEPLSLAKDAGMQAAVTTDWTVDATGILTPIDTEGSENVFSGLGSKRFQNAAEGDSFSQTFTVSPGELFYAAAIARAVSGTVKLTLWDVDNNEEIKSANAPSHSGRSWAFMYRSESIPEGCERVKVRCQGVESSADSYWNGLWAWRVNDLRMVLASTWDTAFKIPALAWAHWTNAVSGANKVNTGYSLQLTELPRSGYGFLFERPGPNPNAIQFHEKLLHTYGGIYIQGRRAYGDLTTFTLALSETTCCPIDVADALLRIELLQDDEVAMKLPGRDRKLSKAYDDLRQAQQIWAAEGPADEVEPFAWPSLGN